MFSILEKQIDDVKNILLLYGRSTQYIYDLSIECIKYKRCDILELIMKDKSMSTFLDINKLIIKTISLDGCQKPIITLLSNREKQYLNISYIFELSMYHMKLSLAEYISINFPQLLLRRKFADNISPQTEYFKDLFHKNCKDRNDIDEFNNEPYPNKYCFTFNELRSIIIAKIGYIPINKRRIIDSCSGHVSFSTDDHIITDSIAFRKLGKFPLCYAVKNNHIHIVEKIIGGFVHECTNQEPLIKACELGHYEIFMKLLECPNVKHGARDWYALKIAVKNRHYDIVGKWIDIIYKCLNNEEKNYNFTKLLNFCIDTAEKNNDTKMIKMLSYAFKSIITV